MAAGWQATMAAPSSSSHVLCQLQQRHNVASLPSLPAMAELVTWGGSTWLSCKDQSVSPSFIPRPADDSVRHRLHRPTRGRLSSSPTTSRLWPTNSNRRRRSAAHTVRRQHSRACPSLCRQESQPSDYDDGRYRDRRSRPSRCLDTVAIGERFTTSRRGVRRCQNGSSCQNRILYGCHVAELGRLAATVGLRRSSSSSSSSSRSSTMDLLLACQRGSCRQCSSHHRPSRGRAGKFGHVDPSAASVPQSGTRMTTEPTVAFAGLGSQAGSARWSSANPNAILSLRLGSGLRYEERCRPSLTSRGLQCERWGLGHAKRRRSRTTIAALHSTTARPIDEEDDGSSAGAVAELIAGTRAHPASSFAGLLAWVDAYVRFTRPHTVIGTWISIISVSAMALQSVADINMLSAVRLLQALVSAYCINIAIVGLNQVFDVEIDRINKPDLPLASGEWTINHAMALVIGHATAGILIGLWVGSTPLLITLTVSLLLGIAYSTDVPFLRWKRYPLVAAACILCVRAVLVQLGFFFHMRTLLSEGQTIVTKNLATGLTVMCLYSLIIAFFKDIPDVEGDRRYGIQSFSVTLGQRKIFWLCVSLLLSANACMVVVGLLSKVMWSKVITIGSHLLMATILVNQAKKQSFTKPDLTNYYMFVWKLFYAEYLLLPFVR